MICCSTVKTMVGEEYTQAGIILRMEKYIKM
jgi:hypothetical protein